MRKNFLLLIMMIMAASLVIGCSSGSEGAEAEVGDDSTEVASEETETDTAEVGGADAANLGIELHDHQFDEAEEIIEDETERERSYHKYGENLTLPEELPEHFPIPVGMTADSVLVKTKEDSDEFDSLEIWFNDGGNYEFDDLIQLYTHYLEENFENTEIKDYSQYKDDLTVFIGYRDDLEFYIDMSPESDHNIVTISIYTDF